MTGNNPMSFFSDNVDAWGPLEWFDRLTKAVHARNRSVGEKDELSFEFYQNIASSSATRLVSDFEDKVRMALTTVRELEKANVAYVDANTELLSNLESLQRENEELLAENGELRNIVSNCATALLTGAFVSPKCSVDFMKDVPKEIASTVGALRALASTGGKHHAE